MTSSPAHVNQITAAGKFTNGKSSARYDCTVAAGVMALQAFSGRQVSTTELRSKQSDQSGGIGLDDLATAFKSYGLTFRHGPASWATIRTRLRRGDGVVLQGLAGALGKWRASSFIGAHAIYAQRHTAAGVIVNDPLRRSPVTIPETAVAAFYTSGLALAGWFTGSASSGVGAGAGASGNLLGAWDAVSFEIGHVITLADVGVMMAALEAADARGAGCVAENRVCFFADRDPASQAIAKGTFRMVLMTAIGKPWSKALQDDLAGRFMVSAGEANPLGDIGGAIGAAIGDAVFTFVVLGAIAGLLLLGAWRLAGGSK